jgi:hypothetical protein
MSHQDKATEETKPLTSWKEISAYLGRDVRTCRRWEKSFGLPIHRLDPDSEKSRVFAYRDELDKWLHQSKTGRPHAHGIYGHPSSRFLSAGALFLVIGAAAVALFLLFRDELFPQEPADFTIKGSVLAILDDGNKVLWRYDTGLENLCAEEVYRSHFQFKRSDRGAQMPYLLIKDLNLDGRREVLFSLQTQDETREGAVLCFDRKGRPLWQFKAGRRMKCGDKTYSGDYRTHGILAEDLDGDGLLEIIVVSVHRPSWPCQLALLDARGILKGEYWNTGYFNDVTCSDLNGDGVKEIIAGGNNNEYGRGCLAVFDPASLAGGSPHGSTDFRCSELNPGSELFYVLLPRTDVDLAENYPVDAVVTVDVLENRRIQVKTSLTDIFYQFSLDFYDKDVILSHGFIQAHEKARREGKIQSQLNSEYEHDLIKRIRYWDGEGWSPEPVLRQSRKQDRVQLP